MILYKYPQASWVCRKSYGKIMFVSGDNPLGVGILMYILHIRKNIRLVSYVRNLFPQVQKAYVDFRVEEKRKTLKDLFSFAGDMIDQETDCLVADTTFMR